MNVVWSGNGMVPGLWVIRKGLGSCFRIGAYSTATQAEPVLAGCPSQAVSSIGLELAME